jgi:hypothetical protein
MRFFSKNKRLGKVLALFSPSCCLTDPFTFLRAGRASIHRVICGQNKVDCRLGLIGFALLKITLIHIHDRNFGKYRKA